MIINKHDVMFVKHGCRRERVPTLVQHLAFREMINSSLTATNQKQLTYIVPIVSTEIPEREGSIFIQHL